MSTAQYQEDDSISQFGTNSQGDEADQAPLNRRVGTVAGMTFLSRVSGLIRDVVFAYLFGASAAADLFFVAFRIPNFFRRLFAEGAFNQAFVPVLVQYQAEGSTALRLFLAQLSGVFSLTLTVVVIAGIAMAGPLSALFAPGFLDQPQRFAQLADLVRITFPYLGTDLVDGLRRCATKRARQICPSCLYTGYVERRVNAGRLARLEWCNERRACCYFSLGRSGRRNCAVVDATAGPHATALVTEA